MKNSNKDENYQKYHLNHVKIENWSVIYTGNQSFKTALSKSLAQRLWVLLCTFDLLV